MAINSIEQKPVFLTKKEVAGILRCDEKTVARYVKSGYLRADMLGKRMLFSPDKNSILKAS